MLLFELALPFLVLFLLLRQLALTFFVGMIYPLGHKGLEFLGHRGDAGLGSRLLAHRDPFIIADRIELARFERGITKDLLFVQGDPAVL